MLGKSFPAEIRRYQSCYLPAFSHGKLQVLAAAALVQHVCARRVGEDVHPYKKAPLEDQSASELPALLACRFQPVAEYQHPSLQISATRNGTELTQEPTAEASILDKLSKMHSCQWQCVCTVVQLALQGSDPTAFLLALLQQCFCFCCNFCVTFR